MTTDQTQAVYAAEDLWSSKDRQTQIKFGDWNEVQPFYAKIAALLRESGYHIYPPTVRPRKGALSAHYDAATSTVFMPPYDRGGVWALKTGVAIHEFAHHMSPGTGHGPDFRAAMIHCLDVMGWDSTLLEDCYAEAGLTASHKADGITDKVSKLLTHADKASSDEERRTYLDKAENLAATHALNMALIRKRQADKDKTSADRPTTGEMFSLQALSSVTYRKLAVELGSAIARAHGGTCTIRGKSEWMTFYGFEEDIHLTELMFTRVTPMMFEECDRYLKSPAHRETGVAAVSARITFCNSFTWEIGARLRESVERTQREMKEAFAITDGDTTSMDLAIRDKEVELQDYIAHTFKKIGVKGSWKRSRTSSWSGSASSAGKSAAQNANLYGRKELS